MGNVVNRYVFSPPAATYMIDHKSYHEISSSAGHRIPICSVFHKDPKFIILYSHGNAEDLGQVHAWCEVLSGRLQATVFSYDYRGYGPTEGTATEANVFDDIRTVVEYIKKFHKIEDVVFFGRSLGSAPSIRAATMYPEAKALILESPFLTCVKTVLNTGALTFWFDVFRNESNITNTKVPALFVHGKLDEVVPFAHGKRLSELCPTTLDCLWIEGAGHNNIDTQFKEMLLARCAHFMHCVDPQRDQTLVRRRSTIIKG